MRSRSTFLALLLIVVATILTESGPVSAYLKLGTRIQNRVVPRKWGRLPIRYYVTNQDVSGVPAPDFQRAVTRAFSTWNAVDTATTSSEFAGFTQAQPMNEDGMVVIGYQSHPEFERTLAGTTFVVDVTNGEIVESDIFFNTAGVLWSTATDGQPGR